MFVCLFVCQQELCKKIHQAIDKIDDARYDVEAKVQKADKEVRRRRGSVGFTSAIHHSYLNACWENE